MTLSPMEPNVSDNSCIGAFSYPILGLWCKTHRGGVLKLVRRPLFRGCNNKQRASSLILSAGFSKRKRLRFKTNLDRPILLGQMASCRRIGDRRFGEQEAFHSMHFRAPNPEVSISALQSRAHGPSARSHQVSLVIEAALS
jgi:hypothetical protein